MDTQSNNLNWTQRLLKRPRISASWLIVATALWICTVANLSLWQQVSERLDLSTASGIGFVLSLLGLMMVLLCLPLMLFGQRYVLKPLLIAFLLISGVLAYFTDQLSVIFDVEMVRNIFETIQDRNTQEGTELMSFSLFGFLIISMGLPIAFVLWARIQYGSIFKDILSRSIVCLALVGLTVSLVMVNFKYVTYFSRENADLEAYLIPFYTIKSAKQLATRNQKNRVQVFNTIGQDARQVKPHSRRIVGVVVVGETARGDHFSLNGYPTKTNPELEKRNIINFSNATACGTSTAFSVPCMFSFLEQHNYTPEKASEQSNVLDVLELAGVKTIWVDSNSSCKGVCNRIESINIAGETSSDSELFVDGAWQDEKLLSYVDTLLDTSDTDLLLVLHSMGSHGPAYYRRYPENLAQFQPYCQSKAPQTCTIEEIVNAYDNTIVYTDRFLSMVIDKLTAREDQSFLLYASDHGESLGENGVYLHGLPRFMAPEAQTRVPVIAWLSEHYSSEEKLPSTGDKPLQVDTPISHDNLSSSILGLFDVKTSLYKSQLDLFDRKGIVFDSYKFVDSEMPPAPNKVTN